MTAAELPPVPVFDRNEPLPDLHITATRSWEPAARHYRDLTEDERGALKAVGGWDEAVSVEGHPLYARIKVVDGPLTSFPIVERVYGGWQSGVMHYPDSLVESYTPLYLAPEMPCKD